MLYYNYGAENEYKLQRGSTKWFEKCSVRKYSSLYLCFFHNTAGPMSDQAGVDITKMEVLSGKHETQKE